LRKPITTDATLVDQVEQPIQRVCLCVST